MPGSPQSSLIARTPIAAITLPFQRFAQLEAAGGIVLLACTAIALVWANSPWAATYHALWHTQASIGFGSHQLAVDWHTWVNDGLMAIFFFLVGLEIKREVLLGELSSLSQAAFPFIAALGGSAIPALLYFSLNHFEPAARGWA